MNIFVKMNQVWQKPKSPRGKFRWISAVIILVALIIMFFNQPTYYNQVKNWLANATGIYLPSIPESDFSLGLDLQGGAHLVYRADMSEIADSDRDLSLEGARDVIERRVNSFGIAEPIVQTNKSGDHYRLIVELAGVQDISQAITMIGETPILEFKEIEDKPERNLTEEEQQQMAEFNKQAFTKAQEIIVKLNDNADFAELAKEYSEDGSAETGGDLGFASRGKFVPEFEKALFEDLAIGEFTKEPVRTQFGYHIIRKDDARGGVQPDGTDTTEVKSAHILVRTQSETDYVGPSQEWKLTDLTGKDLELSRVEFDPNTGEPQVALTFNNTGKDLFADITSRNINQPVAIFLDGAPISTPVVREEIRDGKAVISGKFSLKEAKLLSQRLNAGALPVPIELESQNTIGAALGKESLAKSLKAGLMGLLAVALFMVTVYRKRGLVAVAALLVYITVTLSLFKLLGVTLTLAGIAGVILSLGMAVDANVLIFERMREEQRIGKEGLQLVEDGFSRAWPSIRDGNISTLLTSILLIWFSTGMVKGFAITLGLGILVSMFSAVVVTKVFLKSLR